MAHATVDMGPTAILPGSPYYNTDRATFTQSECQLGPLLVPPPTDVAGWDAAIKQHDANSSEPDLVTRDALLHDAIKCLGGRPAEDGLFRELKAIVPVRPRICFSSMRLKNAAAACELCHRRACY